MKLGTHNTMTYLKSKCLWHRLFPFMGKCQSVDYKVQHELGAVGYDIRLYWDSRGNLEYRHGLLRFSAENIDEVLSYAQEHNIIVRVLLEIRSYNKRFIRKADEIREKFKAYCNEIEEKYPSIRFFGGQETSNGELLYDFKNKPNGIKVDELHSSVTSLFKSDNKLLRMIDDIFPIIYAKLFNKKNISAYVENNVDDKTYLYLDFIEIQ